MTWLTEIEQRLKAATPKYVPTDVIDPLEDISRLLEAVRVKDRIIKEAIKTFEYHVRCGSKDVPNILEEALNYVPKGER